MVETVRLWEEAPSVPEAAVGCPVSCVAPRPGVRRRAAGLSPPTTNNSPCTVTAMAPSSGSGSSPTIAAVRLAGSTAWMVPTGAPACGPGRRSAPSRRSEEHTSELQSHHDLVCRLLLEKKKKKQKLTHTKKKKKKNKKNKK